MPCGHMGKIDIIILYISFFIFLPFFSRSLNLADACILRSGVKCETANCTRTCNLSGRNKSPKFKDGHHVRRNSQVTIDTAMNNFISGQFRIRMKKMATQVNFYLSPELFGARKLEHIYPIKALLTYVINIIQLLCRSQPL